MKQPGDQSEVPLSLSLSPCAMAAERKIKKLRHGAAGGAGESPFVCKTCSRAFASFQALGGHRTSHLRGRHGLALGLAGLPPAPRKTDQKKPPPQQQQQHECHVCGTGFETGQALGGHMRRHREEAAAQPPPVLLQLFV